MEGIQFLAAAIVAGLAAIGAGLLDAVPIICIAIAFLLIFQ